MSNVVFILGAGASKQCGAPLMADFLDVASDLLRAGSARRSRGETDMSIGKILGVLVVVGGVTLFSWARERFPEIHYRALEQAEQTARAGYTWPARGLRWMGTYAFPSHGGCGNVIRNERLRLVLIDTELLRHSHGPEAAIRNLLPHVLLADDTIVVDRMITLLAEQHSASELRDLMQEAIASPPQIGPGPYEYSIRLFDVEVPFRHYNSDQSPQETLAEMNFVSRMLGRPPRADE